MNEVAAKIFSMLGKAEQKKAITISVSPNVVLDNKAKDELQKIEKLLNEKYEAEKERMFFELIMCGRSINCKQERKDENE